MIDWDRIEKFIGFGRRDAPVVFIGMEERLTSDDALDDDLAIRSRYESPVMDLREASPGSAEAERYFDPDRPPRQPTWRVMADLMLRRDGAAHPTTEERRQYRALRLGRADGDTLLAELLPYPHPKSSDWLYERFGKFHTRAEYATKMLPERIRMLREVISESRRELVVCYGKTNWSEYEALFYDLSWCDDGDFRVAQGSMRVVLTPHASGRAFNTDAQLERLAAIAVGSGG